MPEESFLGSTLFLWTHTHINQIRLERCGDQEITILGYITRRIEYSNDIKCYLGYVTAPINKTESEAIRISKIQLLIYSI